MDYLPQLATLAGILLLACASPGPDLVAVTSHALHERRAGVFVGLGIACAVTLGGCGHSGFRPAHQGDVLAL